MKSKHYILIMAIIVVGLLWFSFHKPQVVVSQQYDRATNEPIVTTATTPASSGKPALPVPPNVTAIGNSSDTNGLADIAAKYQQGLIGKDQAMQAVILEENNKSLDLYGKVVDQYGDAVSGARVQGSLGLNVSMAESGGEFLYTETDSQGLFNFLGIHGAGIGITPQKAGYFYNQRILPGRPANYSPDSKNPLAFTMWRIRGPESLVHQTIDAKIPHDGSSSIFDMATGKKSSSGDLKVTLFRSPSEVRRSGQGFDWSFKIEMLHGGLLKENDPYPYWAPENGYNSTYEITVSSNDVPWQSHLVQNFYFQNVKGGFGLLKADIFTALTPARIKLDFTINPSGSQNLEPDFSK